ncbi:MAG TPA: hypothetical protein VF777_06205 [Phycisphaerales bacterium]
MSVGLRGAVLGILAVAPCGSAGVVAYDLRYTFVYQQLGDAAPTTPGVYVWSSRVDLEDSTDASLASITTPASVGAFLFPVGESSFLASRSFASESSMNWSFPAGLYTLTLAGGSLGGIATWINRPSQTYYPQSVPAFTPASVSAIASARVTAAWPLTFNSFALPAGANNGFTRVTIATDTNAEIYSATLPAGAAGVLIPAGTMLPSTGYRLRLTFSAQQSQASLGFPGATASVAFDRQTIYAFTTRSACDADLTGDDSVDDSDFVIFADAYNLLDCSSPMMPAGCPADLARDGSVDDSDFVLFAAAYSQLLCP